MIKYYLARRKPQILVATLLSALSAGVSTALLAYLSSLAGSGMQQGSATVLGSVLGLIALMFTSNVVAQTYLARYGAATVAELRRSLSERFLRMDYQKLQGLGKHVVTGSLITDVGQLAMLFQVLPLFFFQAMTLLFCLGYLAFVSWKLMLVFVSFMAIAVVSSRRMMRKVRAHMIEMRNEQDTLFECFGALSEGKKELSLNRARRSHFLGQVIEPSIERSRELGFVAQKWWSYTGAWSTAMTFCALSSVIYTGQFFLGLEPATLMRAFVVCVFLMNPINFLLIASRDIVVGMTSARKLAELGVAEHDDGDPAPAQAPPPDWERLAVRGLTHRYNAADPHGFAFGPVDLAIERGETVFVVGGNGSGKSTLALLLSGLMHPVGGHIELDGKPVAGADLDAYRQLFSGVFFDFYLFKHLIDHEGRPAPDAQINGLLGKLALEDKLQASDGVLSTLALSQGQRKRLALVQGYLDDGQIFLFDEWAADQDPEFKHYFYMELIPELKRRGKTVIAITHDEKYFGCADRLVKLEQGRVVTSASAPGRLECQPA